MLGKPGVIYRTLIADPPWRYRHGGCEGGVDSQYPTMTVEDICALPVSSALAPDAVLLLWTTWPKLREGLRVVDAWGFEYVTGFPWVKIQGLPQFDLTGELEIKPQYGVGYWARGCTEPLLIGKRGKASPPKNGWAGLLSPNLRHSRKPDSLYQYAESLPGPYLELFARRRRAGWDAWGDQIKADAPLLHQDGSA